MERITQYAKCMRCDNEAMIRESNTQPPYDERAFCSVCSHTEIRYAFGGFIFTSALIPIDSPFILAFEEYMNSDESIEKVKAYIELLQMQELEANKLEEE